MIALQMDPAAPLLNHVLWAPGVYLVPRKDGRLLDRRDGRGKGFDTALTAGGVLALLEAAWRVIPTIEELPIQEMWVGHRPGSRDDAPIIGPSPVEGLIYATGHHRNGVLLAPLTADVVSNAIIDGVLDPIANRSAFRGLRAPKPPEGNAHEPNDPHQRSGRTAHRADTGRADRRTRRRRRKEKASPSPSMARLVRRTDWANTPLRAGDTVEIVLARQGG